MLVLVYELEIEGQEILIEPSEDARRARLGGNGVSIKQTVNALSFRSR